MTIQPHLTLNALVATRHLTILGDAVFQELQPLSDPSGKPAILSTLPAHSALEQQHSDFYAPCLLPFQAFATTQELLNAGLPVIQVTASYAEPSELEEYPAVICVSQTNEAELLQNTYPRLQDAPIAPRYPSLNDIAGKVVYGALPMHLAIHAAAIVTTILTYDHEGGILIELHPPVTVLPK